MPDNLMEGVNVMMLIRGATYIYPVQVQPNCNGTVVSVEYCYKKRNVNAANSQPIFTLLSLIEPNDIDFTIDHSFVIEEETQSSCNHAMDICCAKANLNNQDQYQYQISSTSYRFAVVIGLGNRELLKLTEIETDQYELGRTNQDPQQTIRSPDQCVLEGMPLLRFFIGMLTNYRLIYAVARHFIVRQYNTPCMWC